MSGRGGVAGYYGSGTLLERLNAALREEGVDPARPSLGALAPYDHFHGRGLEATIALADSVDVSPGQHVLDIGSGLGGPARYFAHRFGCRVTGIDLTAEFCEVARHLTQLLGLDERVRFERGDALATPFADASFDGIYSMNVSMNIADKDALYRELHRLLRAGGWLALSEVARGSGAEPDYPTPWAASAKTSFLSTIEETRRALEGTGFEILEIRDTTRQGIDYGKRSRAVVEAGGKPPHRAVALIHGDRAREAAANTSRAVGDGRLVPIEVLAKKAA